MQDGCSWQGCWLPRHAGTAACRLCARATLRRTHITPLITLRLVTHKHTTSCHKKASTQCTSQKRVAPMHTTSTRSHITPRPLSLTKDTNPRVPLGVMQQGCPEDRDPLGPKCADEFRAATLRLFARLVPQSLQRSKGEGQKEVTQAGTQA